MVWNSGVSCMRVGALKGNIPWNKGIPCSKKTKEKIRKANKGQIPWNKGKTASEETKKHQSEAHIGKYPSEEARKKMSEVRKGNHYPKLSEAMKGRIVTEETKKKLSEAQEGKRMGEENPSWKGGISFKKGYYTFIEMRRRRRKLKNGGSHNFGDWEFLKAQYNWTCPICGKSEPEIKLTEDHIIPISKGGSDNIENIQPLCRSCNSKKGTRVFKVNPDKSRRLF